AELGCVIVVPCAGGVEPCAKESSGSPAIKAGTRTSSVRLTWEELNQLIELPPWDGAGRRSSPATMGAHGRAPFDKPESMIPLLVSGAASRIAQLRRWPHHVSHGHSTSCHSENPPSPAALCGSRRRHGGRGPCPGARAEVLLGIPGRREFRGRLVRLFEWRGRVRSIAAAHRRHGLRQRRRGGL